MKSRAILHLDMDAFFPAVEVLDHPDLRGQPIIVGGSCNRGVVSSASYEARRFGVHSAQPMRTARRLCPDGIFLPVRMSRYREVSRKIFKIFKRFTPLVEPLSIDEAFLDVTASQRLFGGPEDIAKKTKEAIFIGTGLTVSAGVAPSKFVAKIASDMDKPDGLTIVTPDKVRAFLDPLPIKKMWGVGEKTQRALHRLNVRSFRDLSLVSVELLERQFGQQGVKLHSLSMGIDDREVVPTRVQKSLGSEATFSEDIVEIQEAKKQLLLLAHRLAHRMRKEKTSGRTITLKVKYADFVQITRSRKNAEATDDGAAIYSTACSLLERTDTGKRPVRLLGISLSHLSQPGPGEQISLLSEPEESQKRRCLNQAVDSLVDKFGDRSIQPAALINP
ncbi:MAG: DNA polymerase IV [Desulfatiglans sp.]|jgi:DNA polymerase-4|nr:DNA polymerase IV [Thermodesulfobacteriota bacterium]MEE4351622.1 DNA polymerase IV [Desulfatiglans sp.]